MRSCFTGVMFSFRVDTKYEMAYKIEIAKARRWNELVAKYGNQRKKILQIMSREGYNILNYKSSIQDDETA